MKYIPYLTALALVFGITSFALADKKPDEKLDCSTYINDRQMSACEYEVWQDQFRILETKQAQLKKQLPEEVHDRFAVYIKASSEYANHLCSFESSQYMGGTIESVVEIGCLVTETKRQIALIEENLQMRSDLLLP